MHMFKPNVLRCAPYILFRWCEILRQSEYVRVLLLVFASAQKEEKE